MTKMIQIRNVPDDIHRQLKMKAAKEGLSLSAFLLHEATRVANNPTLTEWLEMVSQDPPARLGLTAENIVDAIQEGRAERAEHLGNMVRGDRA